MIAVHCTECIMPNEGRESVRKAFSDAEWHNTGTGHDVMVVDSCGSPWELQDAGWVLVTDDIERARLALDYGVEL